MAYNAPVDTMIMIANLNKENTDLKTKNAELEHQVDSQTFGILSPAAMKAIDAAEKQAKQLETDLQAEYTQRLAAEAAYTKLLNSRTARMTAE